MLYALESHPGTPAMRILDSFWCHFEALPETRLYADVCMLGASACLGELDALIQEASEKWRLERMPKVDRGLLRLGAWELAHRLDVPVPVILDEAIELAKRFGTQESPSFVNGVLDKIATRIRRPGALTPTPSEPAAAQETSVLYPQSFNELAKNCGATVYFSEPACTRVYAVRTLGGAAFLRRYAP